MTKHIALPLFTKHAKATLLIALSGILYGFLGYTGTQALQEGLSVTTMLFWRFFLAAIWMGIYVGWKREDRLLSYVQLRSYILPFILGGIFYGGSSAFYFIASPHIGTGLAMVIFFSYPMFVILFAIVAHGWRFNRYITLSLCAIIVGLFLLRGNTEHPLDVIGIVFALAAALFYAIYFCKSKIVINNFSPATFTAIVCLGAATVFFVLAQASHTFAVPSTLKAWGYMGALALLATAIPIQLLLEGLKYVSSVKASILSGLEPLTTVVVGVILLHESISQLQLLGIIVIIVGTLISQFAREA